MSFTPIANSLPRSDHRSCRQQDESWLLAFLEGHSTESIAEIGPGDGSRAAWLLRRLPAADYRAFEPSSLLLSQASAAIATFAERAAVEGRNLALQLPLEERSQNAVLCLDLLEFLRMDELYMVLSEARRILKPGGLCFLRSLSFGSGVTGYLAALLRERALRWRLPLFGGGRPLELNHYISPEDWRPLREERVPDGWLTRQTSVLERL